MNIFEMIEIIKDYLNLKCKDRNNPLYGIKIEIDPFKQLETSVPFILIEENSSKLITNPQGYVYEYLHAIDLTCVISCNNKNREKYFMEVTGIAENTLKVMGELSDSRYRIIPKEAIPGEVIIGSMKCSAVRISIEVKTLFNEN